MTERDERDDAPTDGIDTDVNDDPEVPAEDALEQRTDAVEHAQDDDPAERDELEADPADVAEQSRAVDVDDDEYRS